MPSIHAESTWSFWDISPEPGRYFGHNHASASLSADLRPNSRRGGFSFDTTEQVRSAPTADAAGSPGVESIPGVCGGNPCVVRTRIPVWTLEAWRRQGLTDVEILATYPTLRAIDLVHAWEFVRKNAADVERQIGLNERA
ncbi:MAG: DUF433 domain-containing protein [Candidatus Brocadiae bacterium]|nr:DUF433 domain-containing protein [Candidatus Brocadiia bacterium]